MTAAGTHVNKVFISSIIMPLISILSGPLYAQDDLSLSGQDRVFINLTYLGTAGWIMDADGLTVLVDPYITRLRQVNQQGIGQTTYGSDTPGDPRPPYGDYLPESDTKAIDRIIHRADYIFVTHAHYDHVLDVPYIANRTRAVIVGTESVTNIARASGVPESRLVTVKGGEDLDFGKMSFKAMESLHTVIDPSYFDSRTVPRDVRLPLRLRDYVEGGSLAYLLRLGGRQVLVFGSTNYKESALSGLKPDVVLAGASQRRRNVYDYAGRLMRTLGHPSIVLPTHWDRYSLPFTDPQAADGPEIRCNLDSFTREIQEVSPRTRVIVPRYFEPIRIGNDEVSPALSIQEK